jgi:glutamyl-tRNA synthetase
LRPDPKAAALLTQEARALLGELSPLLAEADWQTVPLEQRVRRFAEAKGLKLGAIAQPLRAALTGTAASPGIFEVMMALGREESLGRIADTVRPQAPDAAVAK